VSRGRVAAGAGLGLGAILAAPAAAQADDFTVTNLSDDAVSPPAGSLRKAVQDATASPGADRVLFQSRLSGVITLDGLQIFIGDDLEIRGPGARALTVSGAGDSRVFYVGAGIDATLSDLTLTGGGSNGDGGAIYVSPETDLTVSRMTISGNRAESPVPATDNGGGIFDQGTGTERLVVESSTISGNTALDEGGGIYTSDVTFSLRNSTVSGNRAAMGGGVYLESPEPGDEIRDSTVVRNAASSLWGGVGAGGSDDFADIFGTIIADNSAPTAPDLDDGPWPTSFSLIGSTSGTGIADQGSNVLNVDPKLKPLKDNGGPTDTHAFKRSPAKNKIPKGQTSKKDQRGAPRKGKGDIGAYEVVKCEGVIVNRVGTGKRDKLKGTKRKDGMLGLGGNDVLKGKKGRDGLCGGRGKDKLKGGPGRDKLDGGPGKDKEIQ
jgi:predicted outer membrane repeat protein